MFADEHVKIATHEHHQGNDGDAADEPGARHDIHGKLQREHVLEAPAVLASDATRQGSRNLTVALAPLKTRKA
jgi:hypothetical protein